ncbi:MAG: helix-turn-helix domain-containing protein [Bacteroidales bacterium]
MDPYLQKLILEGEHQRLDFKVEISDSQKIARTMVAFSNTDGGRLLIGVKDGGGIAGVSSEEEVYMLKVAAVKYCRPRVYFETRKWEVGKKSVVEVIIKPGEEKPYYVLEDDGRWLAYIRVKDQNLLANRILLKVWERKKQPSGTLMKFTVVEENLLKYLELHESITQEGLMHQAKIPKYVAEKILVNLVSMDLLTMVFTDKEISFHLNRQQFE